MDPTLVRETARATVAAAVRATDAKATKFLGGTVVSSNTSYGSASKIGFGGSVGVSLDGDPVGTNTPIVNVTATALPIGARVIVADGPTGTFIVGSANQAGGKYLIDGQRLTASTASFAFVNIPQCFQYLELVASLRSDQAAGADARLRVNSLATAIYTGELIQFTSGGAAVTGSETVAHNQYDWWCYVPGTNQAAGYFGQATSRILNYNTAAVWPTFLGERTFWAADAGILNGIALTSCTPASTSAVITRIDVSLPAGNFITGSEILLYGVGVAM